MRVLVTGGAGFIGRAVVQALLERPEIDAVRVLDALLPGVHPSGRAGVELPAGAELVVGDVRDAATVEHALAGVGGVCHQAAKVGLGVDLADAPDYAGHNDLGTAVLLAALARTPVRRLVLASSMVVYGEGAYACAEHGLVRPGPRRVADLDAGRFDPPCPVCGRALTPQLVAEDAPLDPRNVYAATKLAQEHLAASWARGVDGSVAALRYHNVYGPYMPRDTPYAGVASIFRSALAGGRAPQVFEDGGQRRDFVHVRDVAGANVLALFSSDPPPGLRAYNVGSGTVTTIGDVARVLSGVVAGPAPQVTGAYRLGDVRHITASSQRLRDELGYTPAVAPEVGLREFATAPLRS